MDAPVRIENRAQLIYLLTEAAELEHGIMCCYLFAASSIKDNLEEGVTEEQLRMLRRWRGTIVQVAVQEMAHMSLACNLLTAVGGSPHLRRPNLPSSPRAYPPSFRLGLAPFCRQSLDGFVFLERPEGLDTPENNDGSSEPPSLSQTKLSDIFSSERQYSTVGHLYRGIEDGFRYLSQKYGGEQLFLGPAKAQITTAYFDLPGLIAVTDLDSALAAIQGIVEQGEGATAESQDSHYAKFRGIQDEYDRVSRDDTNFEPGRPVVWNPYSMMPRDIDTSTEVNLIDDPLSVDVSNLFDGCYDLLMQMLGRVYLFGEESPSELAQLADVTMGMMTDVIGPLGRALTKLPAGPSHPGKMAGPSFRFSRDFNTLPHQAAAWALFAERLKELAAYCGFLRAPASISSDLTRVQTNLNRYAERVGQS